MLTTPPPRESRFRRLGEDMLRWSRRNFTRDNLIQGIKTFAWVGPLTCLIWIYAEREQVTTDNDVSFSIDVRINDPQRIVTLKRPAEKVIVANLSGPRSNLDLVMAKLQRRGGEEAAVEINLPPQTQGELQEFDADAALSAVPLFHSNGITVKDCQPKNLVVELDTLQEQDVEVKVPPEVTNLVGQPAFEPHTVRIRGPRRAIEAARANNKLVAYADLTNLEVLKVPGPHDIASVRIRPLDDSSLSLSPTSVQANIFVRKSDVEYTIPSVIVWVYGPPALLAKYRVDCNPQVLTSVKVTGPPDKIDLLKKDDFSPKPHAMLEVGSEDIGKPSQSRRVRFDFPPDMNLHVSDEDSQRPVEFHLADDHATE